MTPKLSALHLVLAYGAAILGAVAPKPVEPPAKPQPGWSKSVTVLSVYDGDTVVVGWHETARVRLLSCWAPELNAAGGIASREHLSMLADGKTGTLFVPYQKRLGDETQLSRQLGWVWVDGEDVSLNEQQCKAGHATISKPEKPK